MKKILFPSILEWYIGKNHLPHFRVKNRGIHYRSNYYKLKIYRKRRKKKIDKAIIKIEN